MIDYVALGERIRRARMERGFTQEYLASRANISLPHASNIETAKTKVSLGTLLAIANALDVTLDYLLLDDYTGSQPVLVYEALNVLRDCTPAEQAVMLDMIKALHASLQEHYPVSTPSRKKHKGDPT